MLVGVVQRALRLLIYERGGVTTPIEERPAVLFDER
jgi:hypothetical protein